MRIAQVSPLYEAVPPRLYGGTERVVSYLTEELVGLGHEVSLFSSADAVTSAKLIPVRDCALRLDSSPLKSAIAAHLAMLDEVRRQADDFDIIHFHLSHFLHFPLFEHMPERTVTTMHGRLDYRDLPGAYERWPKFGLSSISLSQRRPLPKANWIGNVYHGLPLDKYLPPASAEPDGEPYLAFLGRLSRDKRPDRAIEIARRAGLKLKIAAKIGDEDRAYLPRGRGTADRRRPGRICRRDRRRRQRPNSSAMRAALLFPIDWPEPFGLVVIEAMACRHAGDRLEAGRDAGNRRSGRDRLRRRFHRARRSRRWPRLERLDRRAVRAHFERRFCLDPDGTRLRADLCCARGCRQPSRPRAKAYDRALA